MPKGPSKSRHVFAIDSLLRPCFLYLHLRQQRSLVLRHITAVKPARVQFMKSDRLNLTFEQAFILFCCRRSVRAASIDTLDDFLRQKMNWRFIEDMISLHGIAGHVYDGLLQCRQLDRVPGDVLQNLKRQHRHIAFKNLVYQREFAAILKACNDNNVKVAPLKGILFLGTLYKQNAGIRALSDIDILVEKNAVEAIENILFNMGYQPQILPLNNPNAFHSTHQRRISGLTVAIEAHWDFDYADSPYAIDIAECWQRAHENTSSIGTYYKLCDEDDLILNCFHIMRSIRKGPDILLLLKNFCDIAAVVLHKGGSINWDCFLARSREYKVLRPVCFVLFLVKVLFNVTKGYHQIDEVLRAEGFNKDFAAYAVREYIFNAREIEREVLPFWMVDLATATTIHAKIMRLKELPQIFFGQYQRSYKKCGNSALRAIVDAAWYYAAKAAATLLLWLKTPRKAIELQTKMTGINRETQEMIDWVRGNS